LGHLFPKISQWDGLYLKHPRVCLHSS
jgi:hypothetical protein